MLIQLTAEQVQRMEDFYQKYKKYVDNDQMSLPKRRDPAEFIDTVLELHTPLFEQVIGKSLDFTRVTLEDVKSLAAHTFKDGKAYGTDQINEDNYRDVLMDISRRSVRGILEYSFDFGFFNPKRPREINNIEEIEIVKPVMPKRMRGIMAGVPEQMEEYRRQLDLYQKQQERFRKRDSEYFSDERMEQRENIINSLSDRLEESRKDALYNSGEYRAVVKAMRKVNSFARETVTKEKSWEFLKAHKALGEACKRYIESREGAITARGNERLELVKEIYRFQSQEAENLNEMKDGDAAAKKYAGKTFSEAIAECRTKKVKLPEGVANTVSGSVSKRYKIAVDGVRGYFTEEEEVIDINTMEGLTKIGKRLKANSTDEAEKGMYDSLLRSLSAIASPQKRTETMDKLTGINGMTSNADITSLRGFINRDLIDETPGFHPLLKNDQEATAFQEFMKAYVAERTKLAAKEAAGIEPDSEMGKRNIATSRLASFLNIGHLIAHSERMELEVGSRRMTGVFMEEAVGYDSNKSEHQDILSNIGTLSDPSFQKQVATLYAFDLICGQLDRHVANVLYQVEVKDGVNRLIGIQGIDNDLAFGTDTGIEEADRSIFEVKHSGFKGMDYIPKDFVETLNNVHREDLDFLLGDLLSEEEIDALEIRMEDVKDQFHEIKILDDNEWNMTTADDCIKNKDSFLGQIKKRLAPLDYKIPKGERLSPAEEAVKAEKERREREKAEREAAAKNKKGILTSFFGLSAEEKAKSGKTETQHKDKTVKEKQPEHTAEKPKSKAK